MIGALIAGLVPTALGALAGTAPQLFTKTRTEDRVNNIYSSSGNPALAGNMSGASASVRQERYKETIEEPTTFAKVAPWLGLAGGAAGALMGLPKKPTAEEGITEGKKGRKIVSIEPIEGKQHEEGGEDVNVGGEQVEAEGGEFKVIFDDGTEAVLTAEQMGRLKQGEDIENIVQELPTVEEAKKDAQTNDLMQGGSQVPEQGESASEGAIMARRGILQDDPLLGYSVYRFNDGRIGLVPDKDIEYIKNYDKEARDKEQRKKSFLNETIPDAMTALGKSLNYKTPNYEMPYDDIKKNEEVFSVFDQSSQTIPYNRPVVGNINTFSQAELVKYDKPNKNNPLIPKDNPLFGRELITDKGLQSGINNSELSFSDPIIPNTFAEYPVTPSEATLSTEKPLTQAQIEGRKAFESQAYPPKQSTEATTSTSIPIVKKENVTAAELPKIEDIKFTDLTDEEIFKNTPVLTPDDFFYKSSDRHLKSVYPIEESIKDLNRASLASNALISAGTIAANIGNNVPDFTPSPLQAYDPVNIERVNPNAVLANINKQANTAMRATTEMGKDPTKALGAIFDASDKAIGQVNQANVQAGQSEASINQQGANQVKGMNAEINRFNKASKYQNELDKITQKTQRRQAIIDSIWTALQSYVGGKSMLTQDMINRISGEYGDDYAQVLVEDKQALRKEKRQIRKNERV